MKSIKIAKIFGIDIELHWSWFLVLIYFSWVFADKIFPEMIPKQSNIAYWFCGVFTILMLFVSVIIHELAHSKVAQLFKIKVKRITLLIIGGIAQIENLSTSAKSEFLIAIAGPLSSFLLAGIFWIGFKFVNINILLIKAILFQLFFMNGILAVFNLLPAYPMDGGRVFKTILWAISKNEMRSLKIATRVGQAFGILMAIAGIWKLGFWFVFIGGFLFLMAPGEYKQLMAKKILSQIKAKNLMDSFPPISMHKDEEEICNAEDDLAVVLGKMAITGRFTLFVVENDKVVGIIHRASIDEYIKFKM